MNELHLFAGAGGGILGGILLGHTTVCAVEIEPYCRNVLLQRQRDGILPKFPIWDDVCTFDGKPWRGKVDIVCGGFPCQDISSAGGGMDLMEIKAGYGPRWQGSLAKYNPSIYSWKTRQCLLFEESGECLEIFPRWGMMLGGELSELISPVTITDEKDCGLLPTPIATDWKGGTTSKRKDNGKLRFDQWRDFVKLKYGMTYPHPTHSELRMGFPQEWTDLKPLATDKFRLWLQRHSVFLATEDEMT